MTIRFGAALRGAAPGRAIAALAGALLLCAGPAAAAPPTRIAELVSPADNNGELNSLGFVAGDGDAVAYTSTGVFAGAPEVGGAQGYLARRGAAGWTTRPLGTPEFPVLDAIGTGSALVAFSSPIALDPADIIAGTNDLFVADGAAPPTRISQSPVNPSGASVAFGGASLDLSRIFFDSTPALTADDTHAVGTGLYEWAGGAVSNVTVPDAASAARGVALGGGPGRRSGAVSADGTRIALTSPTIPSTSHSVLRRAVWTRTEGSDAVPLTAPPTADQRFDGASADLSTVVISTTQALVPGDTDGLLDVYAFDTTQSPPAVTWISSGGNAGGCNVKNASGGLVATMKDCEARTLAVSADGSSILFVSGQDPSGNATDTPNLYLYRGGAVHFVATLTALADLVSPHGVELSADGSTVVLDTALALTPDDTDAAADVYRWDAATSALTLVSGAGTSDAALSAPTPAYTFASRLDAPVRNVTDDGSCVFFETPDALVAADTNGKTDVYENCGGTIALVSGGTGPDDSHFIGATGDGRDVFFVTTDALSRLDRDGGASIYDARVGGVTPSTPPTPCSGDACQGPPTPQVVHAGAASSVAPADVPAVPSGAFVVQANGAGAARHGYFVVDADVPAAGTVTITAIGPLRPGAAKHLVADASRKVTGAGHVRLRVVLTRVARRELLHHRLHVTVLGRFTSAGVDSSDDDAVTLARLKAHHRRARR